MIRVMVSNWAIALDFSCLFHVTNGRGDIVLFEPLRLSMIGSGYRQIELSPIDVAPL